jgi:flagellar biosynthesis GTPase FlhF
MQHVKPNPPILAPRRTLLLIGPAGSGKTLTCAKLAVHESVQQRNSVAVISLDAARIGATEPLRSYCELASIPFFAFDSPKACLDEWNTLPATQTLVIDTASLIGLQPPPEDLLALRQRLAEALEVHLILSQTQTPEFSARILDAALALDPTHVLYTHLDETTGLNVIHPKLHQLRSTWCATGRNVPEDLRAASEIVASAADPVPSPQTTTADGVLSRYRNRTRFAA